MFCRGAYRLRAAYAVLRVAAYFLLRARRQRKMSDKRSASAAAPRVCGSAMLCHDIFFFIFRRARVRATARVWWDIDFLLLIYCVTCCACMMRRARVIFFDACAICCARARVARADKMRAAMAARRSMPDDIDVMLSWCCAAADIFDDAFMRRAAAPRARSAAIFFIFWYARAARALDYSALRAARRRKWGGSVLIFFERAMQCRFMPPPCRARFTAMV